MTFTDKLIYIFLNWISYFLVIAFNVIANTEKIGGYSTGEVSDLYDNLFVPASYAFSIWGLIYITLGVYLVHLTRSINDSSGMISYQLLMISPYFWFSCLMNVAWLYSWHHLCIGGSVLVIILLLLSLIKISKELRFMGVPKPLPMWHTMAFRIYLGWISVATIANVSAFLVSINWGEWGIPSLYWLFLILTIIFLLNIVVIHNVQDYLFSGVAIWALIAIASRHSSIQDTPVSLEYFIYLIVFSIFAYMGYNYYRGKRYHPA